MNVENLAFPYKDLVVKFSEEVIKELNENLISIVLFGSVARGQYRKDSDIDLLVICEDLPRDMFKRREFLRETNRKMDIYLESIYEKGYYPFFSIILKSREEAQRLSPLYLDMTEDSIIIYDKENFFSKVLMRMKKILDRLGSKRVFIGKKWYWDLKPDYKFGEEIQIE